MKHSRFYCIAIALLMASTPMLAGTVSMQRAKALGEKFVGANFKNDNPLEWVYTAVTENGRPSFHVFNGTAGGFVIVSACDLTSPILGYAETGRFDAENIPDGLSYFLNGYGQSIDYAEERLKKPTSSSRRNGPTLSVLAKRKPKNTEQWSRSSPPVGTKTATIMQVAPKTMKALAKEPTSAA